VRRILVISLTVLLGGMLPSVSEAAPLDDLTGAVERVVDAAPGAGTGPLVAPGRETEAVVLTGADVASWAAPGDVTAHAPDFGGLRCLGAEEVGDTPLTPADGCTHNTYEDPTVSSAALAGQEGTPTDRLLAYRWTSAGFTQVPFQVDEVFTRYLSNDISGFAAYSNTDEHTTYAFDREGFRWTAGQPGAPCDAAPASPEAVDPVPGLDTDDELVFMARDAGGRAPAGTSLPDGIVDAYEVTVADPHRPGETTYVYLARAEDGGPAPAFGPDDGYVRYERDADADQFVFSESSYRDYGRAPSGPVYEDGTCDTTADVQRRPKDTATVTTPRYRFRYDGRWLMTELSASADAEGDWSYGEDMVDQWKARAFQQRPGGQTPCCGYEEEVNNWGGSSQLLGERTGPVRAIRETWGADSGTNVIRREIFYRDEIQQETVLRVHVVPPLDGIYAQWDHTTAIDTYRNPYVPDGVPVDGRNDEVFGNSRIHVGADGVSVDGDDSLTDLLGDLAGGTPIEVGAPNEPGCEPPEPLGSQYDGWDDACVYNDVDTADPTFSGVNALLSWEQLSGPAGTLVTRWSADADEVTPGGAAHGLLALPYYRDDACFDDGTGTHPGPHLDGRAVDGDEPWDSTHEGEPRRCWDVEADGRDHPELGTARFYQGSIGTHGMHLLAIVDSDNAFLPVPLTEIAATQRMVVLPPTDDNVGERYGRGFEKPLVAAAVPYDASTGAQPAGTWVAGDLHVHTTYSHDSYGGPDDQDTGPDEAYTLGLTTGQQFASAAARGLDYLAITDHNDVRSQADPGFGSSGVIGVPGFENSLDGHAQMLGATEVDRFRDLGSDTSGVAAQRDLLHDGGGVFQVNHPTDGYTQQGELDHEHLDWGYGYDIEPDTVEVWNISRLWQPPLPSASSNDDAIRYWEGWLDRGAQVAATGGSDNHYLATHAIQGPGQPTTWVLVDEVSPAGVLDGLRRGRTQISHQPPVLGGPRLHLEADADADGLFEAVVGDTVPPGSTIRVRTDGPGGLLRVVTDGGELAFDPVPVAAGGSHVFTLPDTATWVRAELLLPDGEAEREALCDPLVGAETTLCRNQLLTLALTSPIYLREQTAGPDEEGPGCATDRPGRGGPSPVASPGPGPDGRGAPCRTDRAGSTPTRGRCVAPWCSR
jgi:hypothetical protein